MNVSTFKHWEKIWYIIKIWYIMLGLNHRTFEHISIKNSRWSAESSMKPFIVVMKGITIWRHNLFVNFVWAVSKGNKKYFLIPSFTHRTYFKFIAFEKKFHHLFFRRKKFHHLFFACGAKLTARFFFFALPKQHPPFFCFLSRLFAKSTTLRLTTRLLHWHFATLTDYNLD